MQAADQREHLLHQQRRQAERRLVEDQQLAARPSGRGRWPASAARRRSSCRPSARCAPAGAGRWRTRLSRLCARRSRARVNEPSSRFSQHGQVREDAPALGHLDQPGLHHLAVVRAASGRRRRRRTRRRPGREQAADGVVERRLAGAVAAQQRHDLAARPRAGRRRAAPRRGRSRRAAARSSSRCVMPRRPAQPGRRAVAQVGLDHRWVARHLGRRALRRSAGPAPAPTRARPGSSPPASRARSSAP